MTRLALVPLLLFFLTALPSHIQAQPETSEETKIIDEIRASLGGYIDLFNQGNADALGAFWVEDATYTSPDGTAVSGRTAIVESFRQFFAANPGVRMEVADSVIEPATDGWAYESGVDLLTYPDGTIEEAPYTAVLRKVGDTWLLQSVADLPTSPPPHSEYLKQLEWLIGTWRDEGEGTIIEASYEWSIQQNTIRGKFTVTTDGQLEKDAVLVIGWDPVDETIRSWMSDSEGGTAEGVWYSDQGKWLVRALHVLPDGRTGSSTRVFQPIDEKTLQFRVINREVDGEMLPNMGPTDLVRVDANR